MSKKSFRGTPEFRKLLEVAGTLEQHEKAEHKLFKEVHGKLKELEKFCNKQGEPNVYGPLSKCAKELWSKLEKHFDRYKHPKDIPTHTGK